MSKEIFMRSKKWTFLKGGEEAGSKGCRPPILQEVHLPLHQEAGGQHVDDVIDGDDACNVGYFED